jgi:hypothetical protein
LAQVDSVLNALDMSLGGSVPRKTDLASLNADSVRAALGDTIPIYSGGSSDTTAIKAMLYRNLFLRFGSLDSAQVEDSTLAMLRAIDSINIILDSLRSQTWATSSSGLGAGATSWKVYVMDTTNAGTSMVAGAIINFYTTSACSGTPTYQGKTGGTGFVTFSVDTGYYYICPEAAGKSAVAAQVSHPTANGVDTVEVYGFTPVVTTDPNLCTVYGTLRLYGEAIAGALISLTLINASDTLNYGSIEFIAGQKIARTAADGTWQINVIPNALLDANSKYRYEIVKSGVNGLPKSKEIVVPDAASVNITTLLGD